MVVQGTLESEELDINILGTVATLPAPNPYFFFYLQGIVLDEGRELKGGSEEALVFQGHKYIRTHTGYRT